jgi:WD40 repeat protein/serine/threonine protein kinase
MQNKGQGSDSPLPESRADQERSADQTVATPKGPPSPPPDSGEAALPPSTIAPPLMYEQKASGPRPFGPTPTLGFSPSENYEISGEIARGGLGRILEAHDRRLRRTVALKELLQHGAHAQARFVREALITAKLQHPAIVPVYEAGQWPSGEPFYAMKKISGKTLDAAIAACPTLAERMSLLPNVVAVADAISYAHSEGVIHRDLKPANVLVGSFGETVVVDWGLAKQFSEPEPGRDAESAWATDLEATNEGLTVAGSVVGTPSYMSPDQARGIPADTRSDVYALGAILYHLVTGKMPYAGLSGSYLLQLLRSSVPPKSVEILEPRTAPDLAAIITKAMAANPEQRYPTAKEFAADLRRFQTGQLVSAYVYSTSLLVRRWLNRHRAVVTVAAILLSALAVTAALSVRRIVLARTAAEKAQHQADNRADELILLHARSLLETDPTATIAWLKNYPVERADAGALRVIAADARQRGIATRVLSGHDGSVRFSSFLSDGRRLISAGRDSTVRLWDVSSATAQVFREHRDNVEHVAISPDEKLVASASSDGTVGLWNLSTGERRRLFGHGGGVTSVAFSPDSQWIASASLDRTVRLWNVHTGDSRILAGHVGGVWFVRFSSDGQHLISASADGELREWELSGTESRLIGRHEGGVSFIAFSPDGQTLASGGEDGFVKTWTGSEARTFRGHARAVTALAWSPDSQRIASASEDETILVWSRSGELRQTLRGHKGRVTSLSFAHGADALASGGDDRTVRIWDLPQSKQRLFQGHSAPVMGVQFSPNDDWLASASDDNTIRVWSTKEVGAAVITARGWLKHVAFSPDGRALVAGGKDAVAYLWTRDSARVLGHHAGPINFVAFSPTEPLVATASDDHTIRLFGLSDFKERVLTGHTDAVQVLLFTPDGKALLSGGSDGAVRMWNLIDGGSRLFVGHQGPVYRLALSPGGDRLASGGQDGTVRVWSLGTEEVRPMKGHSGPIFCLDFSPDGQLLASGAEGLRVWDLRGGTSRLLEGHAGGLTNVRFLSSEELISGSKDKQMRKWNLASGQSTVFRGHEGLIISFDLSPDRRTIASASQDQTVRVWDLSSGEVRVLRGHRGHVRRVAFSSDGQSIASAGDDGIVFLWKDDLPTDSKLLHQWLENATNLSVTSKH